MTKTIVICFIDLFFFFRGLHPELRWQHVYENCYAYGHAYRGWGCVLPLHVPACIWSADGHNFTWFSRYTTAWTRWRPGQTHGQSRYCAKSPSPVPPITWLLISACFVFLSVSLPSSPPLIWLSWIITLLKYFFYNNINHGEFLQPSLHADFMLLPGYG